MASSALSTPRDEVASASAHILVVDDDPAILDGISILLQQAGYQTRQATSAAQAIERLAEPPLPTLVILDVMLPKSDGFAICSHIRQLPIYIPVLMLSARDALDDKIKGLDVGADEYVTKPFEPRELLARVRAMLRFANRHIFEHAAGVLASGPVQLDYARRRALVRGQPVELTSKEWSLLELFLQHPGQVFGREMLLQRVWGDAYLGNSRAIDMLIKRLRAKVEEDPEQPCCIQTVRGFGYRFVPGGE